MPANSKALTDQHRAVIALLHGKHKMRPDQIAQMFGVTPRAVYKSLRRPSPPKVRTRVPSVIRLKHGVRVPPDMHGY